MVNVWLGRAMTYDIVSAALVSEIGASTCRGNARMPFRVLHDSNDVCVSSACEIESLHGKWLVWTCYQ